MPSGSRRTASPSKTVARATRAFRMRAWKTPARRPPTAAWTAAPEPAVDFATDARSPAQALGMTLRIPHFQFTPALARLALAARVAGVLAFAGCGDDGDGDGRNPPGGDGDGDGDGEETCNSYYVCTN